MALVLVVVDEPDTLLVVRRELGAAGYQTVLAADADTALVALATQAVDVVLVDVMMPVQDGWSVLETLSARPGSPPALVLSFRAGADDLRRAARLGAAGSVAGPLTATVLGQAVAALLPASAGSPPASLVGVPPVS